jgi:CBS domain-containing protein
MEPRPSLHALSRPDKRATIETVSAVLKRKGRDVWTITPDATVYEAIEMMAARRIGALVVSLAGEIAGIISERDYARRVILEGRASGDTRVREIMTSPVITVSPENTVDDCLWIMTRDRFRHLPVVEGRELAGIVSIGDLVISILSAQAHTIDQMETYITHSYPK